MKKYAILLISVFLLISCVSQEKKITESSCPEVFISKEHKDFFSSDKDSLGENLIYISTINNFKIKCKVTDRKAIQSILDILFVITPMDNNAKNYEYYYFISILNNQDEVLDYQIFSVNGEFLLDKNKLPLEKTITESLDQYMPIQYNLYKVIIGFVLDKEKYNFINN